MNIIGLDLSLTCTGIALPDGSTDHIVGPKKGSLYDRAYTITNELRHWLLPADLVVIEDIATRHVRTAISMAYLHCLTDRLLTDTPVLKVDPATLKRFATGKGNVDKHTMTVAAIRNGWTSAESTDDETDAWWLHILGRACSGDWIVEQTKYRVAVVAAIGARA